MNMYTPVGSIALEMPFHDAIMLYFCLAVSGSRGSGGPGLGGSSSLSLCLPPRSSPDAAELASFPRSQPISTRVQAAHSGGGLPALYRLTPPAAAAVSVRLSHSRRRPYFRRRRRRCTTGVGLDANVCRHHDGEHVMQTRP